MAKVNIQGVLLPWKAGRQVVVPALSIKQLRDNRERLLSFMALEKKQKENPEDSDLNFQVVAEAANLVHVALLRNYPNMALDEVEDVVDLNNFRNILQCIMGQSGFERVGDDAPATSGEAQA